jgi:CHAT domain-containing protein
VFTFLPLHAAGIYDKGREDCCSDYVVSSYTPTLTALLRAQHSWPIVSPEASRLALVSAPKAHDSTLPVLHSVHKEIDCVTSVAKQVHLSINESRLQQSATLAYTADLLTSSNFAHIACHGIQHPTDPLSSGFCLHDGDLTNSRLMELDLKNAFLAFLSACETAKGDTDQPDQTVHLAATMLFVGFRSVVATMW